MQIEQSKSKLETKTEDNKISLKTFAHQSEVELQLQRFLLTSEQPSSWMVVESD